MNRFYETIFFYIINVSYILYLLAFLGFGGFAPQYLEYLQYGLKIYVSIILIILYNPFTYKERTFKEFDRKIIFTSGIFLLLSTTLLDNVEKYLKTKTQYLIDLGLNIGNNL